MREIKIAVQNPLKIGGMDTLQNPCNPRCRVTDTKQPPLKWKSSFELDCFLSRLAWNAVPDSGKYLPKANKLFLRKDISALALDYLYNI